MPVYEQQLQIGISHIGKDGLLKLGPAVDILQNATWFQIDTETALIDYFRQNHAGMYLVSRQIDIHRLPAYGEHITVKSWVTNCDRLFGYRNTAIYDSENKLCIGAYATGPFVDLTKAAPARISQELLDKVATYPALDMEILPRKIPIPPNMAPQPGPGDPLRPEQILVQNYHLDNYGHMNNARYVDIASAYIPGDFRLKRIRMEYKKMALPGDLIIPYVGRGEGDALIITLNVPDNAVYTVMEFTKK
ncbi:hypothetical protein AGMMS49546_17890 [Spirochaetia bacterium]|nr:hypothetical protein AGMMS49546_17890 [Spirochaetia bacterium]